MLRSSERFWTAGSVTIWVDGLGHIHVQAPCGEQRVFRTAEIESLIEKLQTAVKTSRETQSIITAPGRPEWWTKMVDKP